MAAMNDQALISVCHTLRGRRSGTTESEAADEHRPDVMAGGRRHAAGTLSNQLSTTEWSGW